MLEFLYIHLSPCRRNSTSIQVYSLYRLILLLKLGIIGTPIMVFICYYRVPVSFSWHQNFNIIMDACEEYARRWAKKEDVEVDTLSEWVKSIADVLKRRIRRLKRSVNTRHESIFCDPYI